MIKSAAGPKIIHYTNLTKSIHRAGGFAIPKSVDVNEATLKRIRKMTNMPHLTQADLGPSGTIFLNQDPKLKHMHDYIKTHELTHWLRARKGKLNYKRYALDPIHVFTEEYAANNRAMKSYIRTLKADNSFVRGVGRAAAAGMSGLQTVIEKPISTTALLGAAVATPFLIRKGFKRYQETR